MKIFFLFITIFAIASCGPEKTAREKEQEQIEQIKISAKKKIAHLDGTYFGTVTKYDGSVTEVSLTLYTSLYIAPSISRIEVEGIPVIKGTLLACFNRGSCFKKDSINPQYIPVGGFDMAVYDEETKKLTTSSTATGSNQITFHLNVDGERIYGNVYTQNPFNGYIDVKKVSEQRVLGGK